MARVVITTIQRLYSMLKGEPDLDPDLFKCPELDPCASERGRFPRHHRISDGAEARLEQLEP